MPRLESVKRLVCRWFSSILFFVLLGLILGGFISVAAIPKPNIGIITISGTILKQSYTDDILHMLSYARDESSIKAVVLQIDSPGGGASVTEQIYLDILRLRQQKLVVASIGTSGASGGYYIAVAANYICAEPTSILGSVGAWMSLPGPEKLNEYILTTGPFKATGGSHRKAFGTLETFRQQFVAVVMSQRGERLKLSEVELSRAEIYTGVEGLRYGLIDDIGTSTNAIEKAASLAGVRNFGVIDINQELDVWQPVYWPFAGIDELKSQTGTMPGYYYLYFESE